MVMNPLVTGTTRPSRWRWVQPCLVGGFKQSDMNCSTLFWIIIPTCLSRDIHSWGLNIQLWYRLTYHLDNRNYVGTYMESSNSTGGFRMSPWPGVPFYMPCRHGVKAPVYDISGWWFGTLRSHFGSSVRFLWIVWRSIPTCFISMHRRGTPCMELLICAVDVVEWAMVLMLLVFKRRWLLTETRRCVNFSRNGVQMFQVCKVVLGTLRTCFPLGTMLRELLLDWWAVHVSHIRDLMLRLMVVMHKLPASPMPWL